MRALGHYLMRGRFQAATVVGVSTVVSWFLVPLSYLLSGVPLGLVALRRGEVVGLQVMAASFLFTAAVAIIAGFGPALAAGFALGVWLPVLLCASVLRRTESQAAMVMAAGGIGMGLVIAMRLSIPDIDRWWHEWLVSWVDGNVRPEVAAQYREFVDQMAPLFNGAMGAGLAISLILALLVARWWQSLLFNPGGFRSEFRRMALPRALGLVLAASVGLLFVLEAEARNGLRDLLLVALFMYLFQGIAAVHRTVAIRGLSSAWLVAMYGLLLLAPQMILFVACLGFADSWMGGGSNAPPSARTQ
ncbi:MAG TPA: hypothetical protein VIC61_04375 [Gammaproteobacteria bacterium]